MRSKYIRTNKRTNSLKRSNCDIKRIKNRKLILAINKSRLTHPERSKDRQYQCEEADDTDMGFFLKIGIQSAALLLILDQYKCCRLCQDVSYIHLWRRKRKFDEKQTI